MFDAQNHNFAGVVVDSVEDSVGASSGAEDACKIVAQGLTNSARFGKEGSGDQFDDGSGH